MSITEASLLREVAVVQQQKTINEVLVLIDNQPRPTPRSSDSVYSVERDWEAWVKSVKSKIMRMGDEK